jgi:uncharacterized protein YegP (UPF0339 family)
MPLNHGETKMAGKFECYKDKAGEFRFRLKAGNGQTILSSESYKGKASCSNGIASVQKNCADPKRFVKKAAAAGKFRFSLTSTNRQIIGISQNYASESGCDNGIKSVANSAPGATIDDQY